MGMKLQDMIPETAHDIEITGLCVDSRKVKPGFLFAAFPGNQLDGRDFIPQAIKAGCTVVLVPRGSEVDVPEGVLVLEDNNPRLRFADLAASFYDAQPKTIAAVTGTNGKSSCVAFISEMWSLLGEKSASIGTLGLQAPGLNIAGGLTTPDAAGLHECLADLSQQGVTHLALEASSHGLDQYRMDGVNVRIAAFTNLSRDHLDYHDDMATYLKAKERLFAEVLRPGGIAVLNADAPEFDVLTKATGSYGHRIISYGKAGNDICLLKVEASLRGQDITLRVEEKDYSLMLPLVGHFQVENALCALGVLLASKVAVETAVPLLEKLSGVAGRMEHMGSGVYVDYAHTPDALKTVLEALRVHTKGDLLCVFGCGGDRDQGKRADMGAIAAQFADRSIVTDDNPRSEDAQAIRAEIIKSCPQALEIADRKTAIKTAIDGMGPNDILVIAGKGHETGQIIGDQVLPFDDRGLAKDILSSRGAS